MLILSRNLIVRSIVVFIMAAGSGTAVLSQSPKASPAILSPYLDQAGGTSADEAVSTALAKNGELQASRKELDRARALLKQAGARPNPEVQISRSQTADGMDNSLMVEGMLPLELGGRRRTRILVARREAEMRELEIADRERLLAAEVRLKFGEALANAFKLGRTDEILDANLRLLQLIKARVDEGRTAPLEENIMLVEVNRLRSARESDFGNVEISLLQLRNLLGMAPETELVIKGDFQDLIDLPPPLAEETRRALEQRPDLKTMIALEALANAQIEQARAEGRYDASLNFGYQRMTSSFPLSGLNSAAQFVPIQNTMNFLKFGVTLNLPFRNRNEGGIEAAVANSEAAAKRREFTELSIRSEVAAAYDRYRRSARAMEIYRIGVQEQARSNLNVIRQTYEIGSKSLLDYITEQRRFIEIERDFVDSEREVYAARIEIRKAVFSKELVRK